MSNKNSKVFVNKNIKTNTNKKYYVLENRDDLAENNNDIKSIRKKIKEVFNSPKYVYKIEVLIKTNNGSIKKNIIGYNNKNIITIDNELIPINSVIDISLV